MTIQDGTQFRAQSFVGDAVTAAFVLSQVRFADADDLLVFVDDVQQSTPADFTVSGDGLALTAVLSFLAAPADQADVRVVRNVQPRQSGDFGSQSSFKPESVEFALDEVARQVHDLRLSTVANKIDLPAGGGVPDAVLAFDEIGEPTTKLLSEFGGWSPILAVVADGLRRVVQVADWVGGVGPKPAVGSFLGAAGFVADVADATDVRGATGPVEAVAGLTGAVTAAQLLPAIGVNGSFYDTNAAVAAANVPSVVNSLRTAGYTSVGDSGGARYRRVGSEPSHAGKIQSNDGAWWELVADGFVTPEQFGCVGDGVANDTSAFQGAVSYLTTGQGLLLRPAATYLVDNVDLPGTFLFGLRYYMGCVGGMATIRARVGGDSTYLVASDRWITGSPSSGFSSHPWLIENIVFDADNIKDTALVLKTYSSLVKNCQFAFGVVAGLMLTKQNQDGTLGSAGTNPDNSFIDCVFRGNGTYGFRSQGVAGDDTNGNSDGTIINCRFDGRDAGSTPVTDYGIYLPSMPGWTLIGNHTFSSTIADAFLSNMFKHGPVADNQFEVLVVIDEVRSLTPAHIGPGNKFWGGARVDFRNDATEETIVFDGNAFLEDISDVPALLTHNNNRSEKMIVCMNNTSVAGVPFVLGGGNTLGVIKVLDGNYSQTLAREVARTETQRVVGTPNFFVGFEAVSRNDGAQPGPYFLRMRESASPAVNDSIGIDVYRGRNSIQEAIDYIYTTGRILDPTDGSEDGALIVRGRRAGSDVLFYQTGGGYIRTEALTVANLPTASIAGAGARATVNDANSTTFHSIVAGGGANTVPVFSDGTNWRIG